MPWFVSRFWSPTGHPARTRFSMLETIRQFGEEQLVATGEAENARAAHARYFAGREADVLALWDSPRQREAYGWFALELANLRAAFRWAADHDDIDTAATIATYGAFVGTLVEQYEPLAWAEEIIEPARALQHRRLVALYVTVTQIYLIGRIDDAIQYSERAQNLTGNRPFRQLPVRLRCIPRQSVHSRRSSGALGTMRAASNSNTMTTAMGTPGHPWQWRWLLVATRARRRPHCAVSSQRRRPPKTRIRSRWHSSPKAWSTDTSIRPRALAALRRSLNIAQESGNRFNESHIAVTLSELEVHHGAQQSAFDHLTLAMRNYQDSGNIATQRSPLAILAASVAPARPPRTRGHHRRVR